MDNNTLQSIKDSIFQNNQIGVVVGRNPNLDEMAAALSLFLALKEEKNVVIACPSEPIVAVSSLVGIDKVSSNLNGQGGDLVVSFPYTEGEIEKVSYTLEDGYLNILVKAGEIGLSFNEKDVKYQRKGNVPTLLFVVGTARLSDLENLFDPQVLKDTTVINIDNKGDNQGFGDIVFVSSKYSSVCEQVANFLVFGEFKMDVDIAQNLLSGISFATNNFQHPKTSVTAFEMAAILMKKGAVRVKTPHFPLNMQQLQPQSKSQGQVKQFPKNLTHFMKQSSQNVTPASEKQINQIKETRQAGEGSKETPSDWLTPKVYKSSNLA